MFQNCELGMLSLATSLKVWRYVLCMFTCTSVKDLVASRI